jgi:hypothetical protein
MVWMVSIHNGLRRRTLPAGHDPVCSRYLRVFCASNRTM